MCLFEEYYYLYVDDLHHSLLPLLILFLSSNKIDMEVKETPIGQLVADDYRNATVFKKHGIDFCCGGGKKLIEVCEAKSIPVQDVLNELEEVKNSDTDLPLDYKSWSLSKLIDYIVENHHSYVREAVPMISEFSNKVARVHGERHPESIVIAKYFEGIASELMTHLLKEEQILFPFIKDLEKAYHENGKTPMAPFSTIDDPIRMMKEEHEMSGFSMEKIAEASDDFTIPESACATHTVSYLKLKEFQEDLFKHVHLENNVLFPKAIELERKLNSNAYA
jgi:regulator of cell morphogenesis and NO signaling